jgi:hypothetical protein
MVLVFSRARYGAPEHRPLFYIPVIGHFRHHASRGITTSMYGTAFATCRKHKCRKGQGWLRAAASMHIGAPAINFFIMPEGHSNTPCELIHLRAETVNQTSLEGAPARVIVSRPEVFSAVRLSSFAPRAIGHRRPACAATNPDRCRRTSPTVPPSQARSPSWP